MLKRKMKPVTAAVGTAFVASLAAASVASADDNPFGAETLERGYDLLASGHGEGKCGEGKCGEGQCGEDKGDAEGKCGEGASGDDKDDAEGKCGEGKCGSDA